MKKYDSAGASEYLHRVHGINCRPKTLANRRSSGTGPRYSRVGLRVVYEQADLDKWAEARTSAPVHNTTEERAAGVRLPSGNQAENDAGAVVGRSQT